MVSLVQALENLEVLAVDCNHQPELLAEVQNLFSEIAENLKTIIPANEVIVSIDKIKQSLYSDAPLLGELILLARRLKNIILWKQSLLPLGIPDVQTLHSVKPLVMQTLVQARQRFQIKYPFILLPEFSDTRVFIVGSRARGFSRDKKYAFSPGRDADILLVGDNIFSAETIYIGLLEEQARTNGELNRANMLRRTCTVFRKKGFIEGHDRRFVPPFFGSLGRLLGPVFADGDFKIFGEKPTTVLVNFHIASPQGKKALAELRDAIECQ